MDYLFISFDVPDDEQDLLIAELYDIGFDSFEQEGDILKAYINEGLFNKDLLNTVFEKLSISRDYKVEKLPITNWNAAWESNFSPIIVEDKLVIRANFHEKVNQIKNEIVITPQMSFGTGHHDTTYLTLKTMLGIDFTNQSVLDVGCGTGILAIYAKMQNAIKVVGVDNDPWAFKNAQTNEKESNVSGINWIEGVLEDVPQFKFDYVIANINKNVIKQDISNYYDYLKPGGNLFLSGFYLEDVHELNNLAYNLNLKILATNHQNDWAMLHFKK